MRQLQGMNLSQGKYPLYCSVYSEMFAFSSYYSFSSCISWISSGHNTFSSGGHENLSQLTCSCYNMTLLLPIGRWCQCSSPLRLGGSLCLSSSGVDGLLCDFQDDVIKGKGASSWIFFLRHLLLELELCSETVCYEDTWITCTGLV